MSIIYTPKGKAREYSPLALNHYKSCSHGCIYCYAAKPPMNMDTHCAVPKNDVLDNLINDLATNTYTQQVLLSFIGDPYCPEEMDLHITRRVLTMLSDNHVSTAILTKGGERCMRDLDIFMRFGAPLKVGATLTAADDDKISKIYEPNAALPLDRTYTLYHLHSNGIMTWVSLEPVIVPAQSLQIIRDTHTFVDHYAVGKLNHMSNNTDWTSFGNAAVELLRGYCKPFYIKKDLQPYITIPLTSEEIDMDALTLRLP
jgi:DNA repair photolyase